MILRHWFRFLGLLLLVLIGWGSLWAGFENFNPLVALRSNGAVELSIFVIFNYGLVVLAIWLLRGGPQFIRNTK